MFSKRAQMIDSSGIRKVFDLAAKMDNPINLSIGQPDFDVPDQIREAAVEAISSRKNGYTATQGVPRLREMLRAHYGLTGTSDDVFISCGVSGGLYLAYAALLDEGDEVLMPDPYFCIYRDLAYLVGAKPVFYDTYPSFKISIEELERQYSEKTKLLIINSPSNPTGYVLSEGEVSEILAWAAQKGIWVISDEIYSRFSYDGQFSSAYGRYEKCLVLDGFSKSHGCPGWRLGWVLGARAVIDQMLKIQQYTFVCAPTPLQTALGEVSFDRLSTFFESVSSAYKAKRDRVASALSGSYDFVKPAGAFYFFIAVPRNNTSRAGLSSEGTPQSVCDADQFIATCVEHNLLVVPGNVFSRSNTHFRLSFAASDETIGRGLDVLTALLS